MFDKICKEDLQAVLDDSHSRIYSICEVLRIACYAAQEDSKSFAKRLQPEVLLPMLALIQDELDAQRTYLADAGIKL